MMCAANMMATKQVEWPYPAIPARCASHACTVDVINFNTSVVHGNSEILPRPRARQPWHSGGRAKVRKPAHSVASWQCEFVVVALPIDIVVDTYCRRWRMKLSHVPNLRAEQPI